MDVAHPTRPDQLPPPAQMKVDGRSLEGEEIGEVMRGGWMRSTRTRKRDLESKNQQLPVVAGRMKDRKTAVRIGLPGANVWSVRGDVERCNKVLGVGRGSATAKGVI